VPTKPAPLLHRVIAANVHAVPAPFRAFAVRSDEPQHAGDARAPYCWVHVGRTAFLDAGSLASLASAGDARVSIETPSDIDYATTMALDLAAASPRVPDLVGSIASALQLTGVLGADLEDYRRSVGTRIDTWQRAARVSTTTSVATGRVACSGCSRSTSPTSTS